MRKTKPGVRDALAGLSVIERSTLTRGLVEPRAAINSGCAAGWKAPLGAAPVSPLEHPLEGTGTTLGGVTLLPSIPFEAQLPGQADALRWCRYATEAIDPADPADSADSAAAPSPRRS